MFAQRCSAALFAATLFTAPLSAAPGADSPSMTARAAAPSPATNGDIRIATWTFDQLWEEAGKPLRPGAPARTHADFERLRKRAKALAPDILVVTGAGSMKAVRRVLPASTHHVVFSRDLALRLNRDRRILTDPKRRRTYVAIAIRRKASLRILAREHILVTAGNDHDEGAASVAILVRRGKQPLWILGVDFARRCNDEPGQPSANAANTERKPKSAACRMLAKQFAVADEWIALKQRVKQNFVVAGRIPHPVTRATHDGPQLDPHWMMIAKERKSDVTTAGATRRASTTPTGRYPRALYIAGRPGQPEPERSRHVLPVERPTRPPKGRLPQAHTTAPRRTVAGFIVSAVSDFTDATLRGKRTPPGKPKPDSKLDGPLSSARSGTTATAAAAHPNPDKPDAKRAIAELPDDRVTRWAGGDRNTACRMAPAKRAGVQSLHTHLLIDSNLVRTKRIRKPPATGTDNPGPDCIIFADFKRN